MMNGNFEAPSASIQASEPSSFVVIPDTTQNSQMASSQLGLVNGSFSMSSFADLHASLSQSDMSLEEAMTRVVELMKENQELKLTVRNHTEMMKKQFEVIGDFKGRWNAEQEEFKRRHAEAKDVVLALNDSHKEKDAIINELRNEIERLKTCEPSIRSSITDCHKEVVQLRSDNAQLLRAKLDMGRQVQDLTDEVIQLKEQLIEEKSEQVIVNVEEESVSMKAHLISIEKRRDTAEQQLLEANTKMEILKEDTLRHINTIEDLTRELAESKAIQDEISSEYNKLTEQHDMLQSALQRDKEMMQDTNFSLKKIQDSYEKLVKEKQELLALNNQLVLQIQAKSPSPLSEQSIEEMLTSPSDESSTSDVVFARAKYLRELEKKKRTSEKPPSFQPFEEGFTTVSLTGESVELFLNQNDKSPDGPTLRSEIKQAEKMQGKPDDRKKRSREDNAISDLLLQLRDERSKVTDLTTKNNALTSQIENLALQLEENKQRLAASTMSVDKLSMEKDDEREQLLNKIELLREELNKVQDNQDEPLQSLTDVTFMHRQIECLIKDLKETESKHYAAIEAIDAHKQRSVDLQAKVEMYQEEIEVLRSKDDQLIDAMRTTITSLEQQIVSVRHENHQKSQSLEDLRGTYEQLCTDYHEMLTNIEDNKVSAKGHDDKIVKIRTEYQSHLDNLTAKLITTEEALATQQERYADIKTKFLQMKTEAEDIPVLQAQAEIYKNDFEAERRAREELAAERDSLKEEVESIHQRHQQLLDEMQAMTAQQVSELQRRHAFMGYTQAAPMGGGVVRDVAHVDAHQTGPQAMHMLRQMRENIMHQHGAMGAQPQPAGVRPPLGYALQHGMPPPPDLISGEEAAIAAAAAERLTREASPFEVQRAVAANAAQTRRAEEEEQDEFRCPKCDMLCPDFDTLNLHVNECLDQD